ncbi:MAG: cupin domain-containing protein [Chloroflexi bacterium]|nr:cupin domain-containing protein [Chloroflexota bacterium]
MPFLEPEHVAERALAPGVTAHLIHGERMTMSLVAFAPHSQVPLHSHPHEQMGRVLAGDLEMTIDGETRVIKEGDGYLIPGGVAHRARSREAPCTVLDIFSPVREDYR